MAIILEEQLLNLDSPSYISYQAFSGTITFVFPDLFYFFKTMFVAV